MKHITKTAAALCLAAAAAAGSAASLSGAVTPAPQAISASAADTKATVNHVYYTLKSDLTATITGFDGAVSSLTIPKTIKVSSKTYRVTEIAKDAFWYTNLASITLSGATNLKKIGDGAFSSCAKLKTVKFAASQPKITFGRETFANCTALTSIVFPDQVQSLGGGMFYGCTALKTVTLPKNTDSLTNSGAMLGFFGKCSALTSITIPASCLSFSRETFEGCTGLTAYKVESGNPNYAAAGGVLFSKDKKTLIAYPPAKTNTYYKIPLGVTCISGAFRDVKYLQELDLSNCTNLIKNQAFSGACSIKKISIPFDDFAKENFEHWMDNYEDLLNVADLETINNTPVFYSSPDHSTEPYFNDRFQYVFDNSSYQMRKYDTLPFMDRFCGAYADYVVKTVTRPTDNDLTKALKLHDWLAERENYDYDDMDGWGNHCFCSVFLHKKADGKYYTVCEGYGKGYQLLLEHAGIESAVVSGEASEPKEPGHAWTLAKLNGNYYHIDVTWDDSVSGWDYDYFMKSDDEFNTDGHRTYTWETRNPDFHKNRGGAAYLSTAEIGDLSMDGKVSIYDVALFFSYLENHTALNDNQKYVADLNMDGSVTWEDAYLLACNYTDTYNSGKTLFEAMIENHFYKSGIKIGDVNSDGFVNMSDASMVLSMYADASTGSGAAVDIIKRAKADINRDGAIDASDASMIMAYYSALASGYDGTILEYWAER